MNKQILLAIVLVVLAAALAYGGWWVWYAPQEPAQLGPTPEVVEPPATSTAAQVPEGWNVYENQVYGYLIRYPQTIRLSSGDLKFIAFYGGDVPAIGGLPPKSAIKISISPFTNVSQATVVEWVKTFGPRYEQQGVMTIAGERAIYGKKDVGQSRTDPEDPNAPYVPTGDFGWDLRVIHNSIGYQIAYTPYDSDWKPVFEQMLATFEFTK
ncbi:MAG: hypothetical protein ACRD1X_07920 [Vicinamibacteria bacterium]